MEKAELAFRKVFLGMGDALEFLPIEAEWKDLHTMRSKLTREMKSLLDRVEKDARNLSDEEKDAFALGEKLVTGICDEMDRREAAGDKRPVGKFVPVYGSRRGDGTVEDRRQGIVGASWDALFGNDKGGYKNADECFRSIISGEAEQRTMVAGTGAFGGFTVPSYWHGQIWSQAMEESVAAPRCRYYGMPGAEMLLPAWKNAAETGPLGGARAEWLEEGSEATKQTPQMRMIRLSSKKLAIFTDVSRELWQDGLNFSEQIMPALASALAWHLDYEILRGSDVNRPCGVLTAASTIKVKRASANDVTYPDLVNLYTKILPVLQGDAVWICSPAVMQKLLSMVDGASHYVFGPAAFGSADGKVPASIFGKPLFATEKLPALGSCGDLLIANFGAYAVGLRENVTLEKTNAAQWEKDLISLRGITRLDGRPLLNEPVTIANGAVLSWAATLDTP